MSKLIALNILLLLASVRSTTKTDTTITVSTSVIVNDTTLIRTTSNTKTPNEQLTESADDKRIYVLKPAIDIPVTAISAGFSAYAFTKIYSKDRSTEEQINALRKEDINGFDRWAT